VSFEFVYLKEIMMFKGVIFSLYAGLKQEHELYRKMEGDLMLKHGTEYNSHRALRV
jgi:hypothetical protein